MEQNTNARPRQRPKILTDDQENEIIRRIRENPFLTAISFAREYGVTDKTISAIFKRNGLKCQTAAVQTALKEEHRINRIAFCENMLEWPEERLNSIIFSDEKTFCSDVKWRSKVYRPYNTRYEPHFVKTERMSGRITAAYWGAISINGPVTELVKINGKLSSSQYLRVIRRHLTPVMQNNRIFMQDNSPVHTARNVMEFLSRRPYETMPWPPLSPDLNPIENVWSYLTNGWPLMENRTEDALNELVQRRWQELRNNPGMISK